MVNFLPTTIIVILFIIFDIIFIIIIVSSNYFKTKKIEKLRQNIKNLFSDNEYNEILNSVTNSYEFIKYLKAILGNKTEKQYIIELTNVKNNSFLSNKVEYLKFLPSYDKIEILSETNKYSMPTQISYSDIDKIILDFKTFSEASRSGRSSTTYYYNQYIVKIKFKIMMPELYVYDNTLLVSTDKGSIETESRAIGELLAKIFKVNLVRIDGTEVSCDKLDESVLERLNDFVKKEYSFKEPPFITRKYDDHYSINKLKYYNVPKMVLGIIAVSIIDVVFNSFFLQVTFFNQKDQIISQTNNSDAIFKFVLVLIASSLLLFIFILYWIKNSKNKIPDEVPLLLIYKDKILSNLKYKNNNLISSSEILISKIEEIVVRYEKSIGYSVKLISDEKNIRVASYYEINKADYLKDEIIYTLKNFNL